MDAIAYPPSRSCALVPIPAGGAGEAKRAVSALRTPVRIYSVERYDETRLVR